MYESIYLPHKYFKGLEQETELPHTLYHYYQQEFNLTVQDTQDSIKASLATKQDTDLLGVKLNSALLEVRRTTRTIDKKIIEYRISRCRTDNFHYLVDLG